MYLLAKAPFDVQLMTTHNGKQTIGGVAVKHIGQITQCLSTKGEKYFQKAPKEKNRRGWFANWNFLFKQFLLYSELIRW